MRKVKFTVGEYYHIYNRGTDKRNIFMDEQDLSRFWESLFDFNQTEPIGSIYEFSFKKKSREANKKKKPLVQFIVYCLNPNHIHSNQYLLHLSAYIKGNDQLGHRMSKLSKSSLPEFLGKFSGEKLCNTDIILGQFRNIKEYKDFVVESLEDIKLRKEMIKELEN